MIIQITTGLFTALACASLVTARPTDLMRGDYMLDLVAADPWPQATPRPLETLKEKNDRLRKIRLSLSDRCNKNDTNSTSNPECWNKKARVEAIRQAILSQILPDGVGEDKLPSAEDLSKEGFGPAVNLELPQLNQPGTVQVWSSEQLQESGEDLLSNEINANLPGENSPALLQRVLDAASQAAAMNNQEADDFSYADDDGDDEACQDCSNLHISFYPECSSDRRISLGQDVNDEAVSSLEEAMKLRFNLSTYVTNSGYRVNSAILKLYRIDDCHTRDTVRATIYLTKINGTDTVQEIEWTAIVSQETPCGQPVSFDLTRAVKRWLQHPEDNLGVVVKVEDRQENMIDPRAVFKSLECVNGSRPQRPIPSRLADISRELMESNDDQESLRRFASSLNTNKYPILDVGSIEISDFDEDTQALHIFERATRNNGRDQTQQQSDRRQLRKGMEINFLKQGSSVDAENMMRADILGPIASRTAALGHENATTPTTDDDDGTPLSYRLPVLSREKFEVEGTANLRDEEEAAAAAASKPINFRSHSRRHTSSPSSHHQNRHHRRHRHRQQWSNRKVILTAEELQELVQTVNLEATTADHTKDIVRKIRERMASAAAPKQ